MTSSIRLMVSDIVRAGRELAEQTRATFEPKHVLCPVCEGRGQLDHVENERIGRDGNLWHDGWSEVCPACNGGCFVIEAPDDDAEERAAFDADPPPDIEPLGDDEPREDYVRDLQDRFTEDE